MRILEYRRLKYDCKSSHIFPPLISHGLPPNLALAPKAVCGTRSCDTNTCTSRMYSCHCRWKGYCGVCKDRKRQNSGLRSSSVAVTWTRSLWHLLRRADPHKVRKGERGEVSSKAPSLNHVQSHLESSPFKSASSFVLSAIPLDCGTLLLWEGWR